MWAVSQCPVLYEPLKHKQHNKRRTPTTIPAIAPLLSSEFELGWLVVFRYVCVLLTLSATFGLTTVVLEGDITLVLVIIGVLLSLTFDVVQFSNVSEDSILFVALPVVS